MTDLCHGSYTLKRNGCIAADGFGEHNFPGIGGLCPGLVGTGRERPVAIHQSNDRDAHTPPQMSPAWG